MKHPIYCCQECGEETCETVLKREAEIRKETILAVLPERNEHNCGYNDGEYVCECFTAIRQSIIDSAKEKFNIDI